MNTTRNETLLFASETSIFRIVSIARIVSWVVLVIYLYSFVENVRPLFQGQMPFPTEVLQGVNMVANLIFPLAIGLFYFLVLQGIAQILNLGLDIFYELRPEEEKEALEEEIVEDVVVEEDETVNEN